VATTNRLRILALALALALVAVVLALVANPAPASTTIKVTTTKDENNTNRKCSLREAIIAANTDARRDACPAGTSVWDFITVPAGTYKLSLSGEEAFPGDTGDLDITDADGVTIKGAEARKTIIDGQDIDRIFDIRTGAQAEVRNLTITNGSVTDGERGGGVQTGPGSNLYLTRVAVTNNTADHSCGGCFGGGGGGIANNAKYGDLEAGNLSLSNSTVSGNTVSSVNGGGGLLLGVFPENGSQGDTQVTDIVNSTISGNSSLNGDAGAGQGGGINTTSGLTRIWTSTITNNKAPVNRGSGVASFSSGQTDVHNTIISKNANNADVSGTNPSFNFVSYGYNLIGGGSASSAFNESGDQISTNPKLGPLRNNGGPTNTHALLSGSPALDAAPKNTTACGVGITVDQRGVKRPQGKKCDIGAYEKQVRRR
jgi:CSLREA domain-containing protein